VIPTTALYTAAWMNPNHMNASAFALPASTTIVATMVAFQSLMTCGSTSVDDAARLTPPKLVEIRATARMLPTIARPNAR
jgi:hypothetical protein